MEKYYDVVIIGGGPGGYVAAIRLGQYGKKVALIEQGNVGGVCLNVGCIPSKAMIYASELFHKMGRAGEMGITVTGVKVDSKKLQRWKRSVVGKLTGGVAGLLKANGVEWIKGKAAFNSKREIVVTSEKSKETVGFDAAIIATGSRPIEIPGFKFDGKTVISSTEALEFDTIPKTMVVIGGGYIGLEIGSLYAAFGTKVTVVEAMNQILPGTDPDLVSVVARELKMRGVAVYLNARAKRVEGRGTRDVGVVVEKGGAEQKIKGAVVLVAVGRVPNSKNLGLESVGVKVDAKGFITINHQMKTNADGIYAIGDVAGQPMLAHKASKEGLVAADVIIGKKTIYDVRAMPAVIFTTPEVATVGLTETAAKAKGIKYKLGKFPFAASGKALATGSGEGFIKILADEKTDVILGVGIVGHEASSLIGEAALAIEMGALSEDVALTVHPHPTLTEAFMEAAEAVQGKAVHIWQKK